VTEPVSYQPRRGLGAGSAGTTAGGRPSGCIPAAIARPDRRDVNGRRPPESMYGTVKMWGYLQRQGIEAARCTIERLKRAHGWRGVTRARRPPRTTVADPAATRAPDLVRRQFRASRPGELVVADFTYVPMDTGRFGYTAFAVDAQRSTPCPSPRHPPGQQPPQQPPQTTAAPGTSAAPTYDSGKPAVSAPRPTPYAKAAPVSTAKSQLASSPISRPQPGPDPLAARRLPSLARPGLETEPQESATRR
jgi:HTH-like domain